MWILSLIPSCHREGEVGLSQNDQVGIDSVVSACPDIDSLQSCLRYFERTANELGVILAYKELEVRYREAARFNEAIGCHREGLRLAMQRKDTSEVIQALNNIGTNFRRLGIMDEASNYHYRALSLCERLGDKESYKARKNRTISLSGIGNVYLTLENCEMADSIFRIALEEERTLDSDLGLAMNYANLGSIFEMRGMMDSAFVYYNYSMEHNRAAGSVVGISLCHNHIGRLFEKKGQWDQAIREYRNAYDLMVADNDLYHWLESCLALARVNIYKGDLRMAEAFLEHAEGAAKVPRAWKHLSSVYHLDYLRYKKLGDYKNALNAYTSSLAYADSMRNTENMNHIQNLRVDYEKERSNRKLSLIQKNYEMGQRTKNIFLIACLIVLFLTVVAMGFLWYALRMKSRNQQVMRRMEEVRANFFTNVTHEFRTPLTVILGVSEELRKGGIGEEELKTGLNMIGRQGKNLLELVNQLLEVAKVRSEIGDPEWRTGDIVAYTSMIVEDNRAYARQGQVDLCFTPSETIISMDFVPEYFRRIMDNLLRNAIKFTPRGGRVVVTMECVGSMLVTHVADTGCGIAEEDLPHIFKAFYLGETGGAGTMGTGIGLSLVRQMVRSMEGRVSVKSTAGVGSEFVVMLPLRHGDSFWERWVPGEESNDNASHPEPDKTVILPDATMEPDSTSMRPSILIVEDNADISYYIGRLLNGAYQIIYAQNGAEGLEIAAEQMPDLILTDLMMPEMDGYELCRRVRESEVLNHIPIIIITAKSGGKERVCGLEVGADAYLEKPFNAEELNIRITKLLEQRRLLREKYSKAMREGTELNVKLNPADQDFLARLNDYIYALISNHGLNSDMVDDKMCMSRSQLNRKVRAITGYNTSAYILQMRMERSKRLLASTEELIGDIALKCGFEDANYFAKIFKKQTGVTPSEYREKNLL